MTPNLPHDFLVVVRRLRDKVAVLEGRVTQTTPRRGTAVLVAGTVTVALPSVTAATHILLTIQTPGGTVGAVYVSARTAGTSFVITSTSATDTSTVAWAAVEPQ